jgi:hypothetical protein
LGSPTDHDTIVVGSKTQRAPIVVGQAKPAVLDKSTESASLRADGEGNDHYKELKSLDDTSKELSKAAAEITKSSDIKQKTAYTENQNIINQKVSIKNQLLTSPRNNETDQVNTTINGSSMPSSNCEVSEDDKKMPSNQPISRKDALKSLYELPFYGIAVITLIFKKFMKV